MNRSQISRRSLLGGVAGAALTTGGGLLTACGGSAGEPSAGSSYSGKPRRGGRLRAAFLGSNSESTSVVRATATVIDYVRARVVWDTLGELEDDRPVWRLASAVEANKDASEWTVRVRDGVVFSDGSELTAEDVLFSLRTLAAHPGGQAGLLSGVDFGKARTRDKHTLTLPLKRPDGFFDLVLAQSMFVFPHGTKNLSKAPGSGPFRLAEWSAGKSSLLKANRNYWGSDDGGPYLDEIELFSVTDPAARLSGLKSGQFDYAGSVALTAARAEKSDDAIRVLLPPRNLWNELSFSMNLEETPFTSAAAVKAVKYAIDREAMVKGVTLGYGEVADDALGKHQRWYAGDLPARDHDPERARALLKKAGRAGERISLRTSALSYGAVESATAFVQQAKEAGLNVRVDKVPPADYYSDTEKMLHTPVQTTVFSPMTLPLQLSNYYGSGASYPFTGPAPERLESLMRAMRRSVKDTDRERAVADVQHYLHDHGGDAVFARLPGAAAATPHVQDVKALGFADYPSLRDAFLSP
ncbi:ABC transporter substrate-binding protein [Streptomyces nanshensis]|uniref:Solute-binding protein family 5 domain-containing protein n=1 Tax=Streptomyces nanshensis TaxID=518642 RepID=A0A1E7L9C2_9ACTN|nr:ABC transporter substrate-binding protein [Streptomyces nanshensis]OEV12825.1 hypothetical protein AN218_06310 [Streptomyces nanshensis]